MSFVSSAGDTNVNGPVDVTLDVGSTDGRKAICWLAQQNTSGPDIPDGTCVRDPGGADEVCTQDGHQQVGNNYGITLFFLDLGSVTGSQTFRLTVSNAGDDNETIRMAAGVMVWDGLEPGGSEVTPQGATGQGVTSISDSITPSTNGAVIAAGVMAFEFGNISTAFATPQDGQTEREDIPQGATALAFGDLVVDPATGTTIGWALEDDDGTAVDYAASLLAAYAPTPDPVLETHEYFMGWGSSLTVIQSPVYFMEWIRHGAMQEKYHYESVQTAVVETHRYFLEYLESVTRGEEYFLEWLLDVLSISGEHQYWMEWLETVDQTEEFPLEIMGHLEVDRLYPYEWDTVGRWFREGDPDDTTWTREDP